MAQRGAQFYFIFAVLRTRFSSSKMLWRNVLRAKFRRAKIFADAGKKPSENLANIFADFRPFISRKSGRKKFHEKSSTFPRGTKQNSFTARFLEGGAPTKWAFSTLKLAPPWREPPLKHGLTVCDSQRQRGERVQCCAWAIYLRRGIGVGVKGPFKGSREVTQ